MAATTTLYVKVILLCYAIISLPYVALALDLRASSSYASSFDKRSNINSDITSSINKLGSPSLISSDLQYEFTAVPARTKWRDGVVVNETTVVRNIPEEEQEVFYFRNFTMVGKKSEGFNITAWEIENNHPVEARALMSPEERQAAGDFDIFKIAAAVILLTIVAVGACIALAPGCGAYVGGNIGAFMTAVPGGGAGVAQGAIELASQVAAGAAAGVRRDDNLIEGRDTQDEEFGCYYVSSYSGTCINTNVAEPAYSMVVDNDSNNANTPDWTCYESKDSTDGTVFGYYSHCFGDNENCELQCGAGNPEVQSAPNSIAEPTS